MNQSNLKYTRSVAISMVIANMVGTGVFTSLGFQVLPHPAGIPDAFAILTLWFVGGIIALCGATVYAEVASTLKESGGEYIFLSKLYHRSIGFVSGWVSLVVGFGSAICLAALAVGKYSSPFLGIEENEVINLMGTQFPVYKLVSIAAIIFVSIIHFFGVRAGGVAQNVLTGFKILLILFFCLSPFFIADFTPSSVSFAPTVNTSDYIFSMSFAGALVWVMLAYSGWNASAYIAGNLENPKRNLPYSLLLGTGIVMILYIALNAVFMYTAEFSELSGKLEIGNEVASILFGTDFGIIFSGVFSLALLSTMSAMVIAGPRVYEQMGNDYSVFKSLAKKGKGGTPLYAISLQAIIAIVLVLFSSFTEMVEFISVTLMIFSSLTVAGIFILRRRNKGTVSEVRAFAYPITPIVFLICSLWMVYYFVNQAPVSLLYTGITLVSGFVIYFLVESISKKNEN